MTAVTTGLKPTSDANTLGLDYRAEAARLPYDPAEQGGIIDAHCHIANVEAARQFIEVADLFGVKQAWSMTQLEQIDAINAEFGDRFIFNAVPNYEARKEIDDFAGDWLRRIEAFAEKGVKLCKFWAAPRGRDFFGDDFGLDSKPHLDGMKLAKSLGMSFMTHVGDPDTWFTAKYTDAAKYGTKAQQYEPLVRLLDEHGDVTWIAAHMAGSPEDLDFIQGLLDRHANLYLDTSAAKWQVRELSKHADRLAAFMQHNAGRILFGSDIVAHTKPQDPETGYPPKMTFDFLASRYWVLRILFETAYDGPSPIVDPDLSMVDPSLPADSTARLCGASLDPATLATLYHGAAEGLPFM